jgi:intein/homing endonuclease
MRNGIWEDSEIQFLKDNYMNYTNSELSKIMDRTKTAIDLKINRLGLKKTKYSYNHNYFENIDTEEKAYWLGFIYADGCVSIGKNNSCELCIKLQRADKEHLKKFNKALNGNVEVKDAIEHAFGKDYEQSHIRFYSQKLVADLIKHGCFQDKTYKIRKPNIDNNLMKHFIRGFFDGDGCITKSSNKSRAIKCDFTCVCDEFLFWLREYLYEQNINSFIYKWKYSTQKLIIGGNKNCDVFLNYIYNDCTIFLERKYKKKLALYKEFNVSQRLLR